MKATLPKISVQQKILDENAMLRILRDLSDGGWTGEYWPIPNTFRVRPPEYTVWIDQIGTSDKIEDEPPWFTPLTAVIYARTRKVVSVERWWNCDGECGLGGIPVELARQFNIAADFNEHQTIWLRIKLLSMFDSLPLWGEFIDFKWDYRKGWKFARAA